MNNRMKKKQEKFRRELMCEIFDLALQVNGLEKRSKGISGTLPTVFVGFSGHVAGLEIRVHAEGWLSRNDCIVVFNLYSDKIMFDGKKFKECRQKLIKLRDGVMKRQ